MHDANCIIPKQADMLTAYHYTHFSFEDHKSCSQHAQRKHAGYQHSSISVLIDHKEKQTREVNERVRIKYEIRNGKGIDKEVFEQQKHFRCRCASRDPKKHGYHVYEDLNNADYGVHTVNSNAEKILGDKCYHNLENFRKTRSC